MAEVLMEPKLKNTVKAITELVFVEDQLTQADLIIVPGSSHEFLPQKASQLYLDGLASRILFTGGVNPKISKTECEFGREIAIKAGVNKRDIYLEDKSTNTKENAIEAMQAVKKFKLKHKKIILVSKSYHSRRLLMTFKAVFKDSAFLVAPIDDGRKINRNNWYKEPEKINKVMEEVGKISEYTLKGDLTIF